MNASGTITITGSDGSTTELKVVKGLFVVTEENADELRDILALAEERCSVTASGKTGIYLGLMFYTMRRGATWACTPEELVPPDDSFVVQEGQRVPGDDQGGEGEDQ